MCVRMGVCVCAISRCTFLYLQYVYLYHTWVCVCVQYPTVHFCICSMSTCIIHGCVCVCNIPLYIFVFAVCLLVSYMGVCVCAISHCTFLYLQYVYLYHTWVCVCVQYPAVHFCICSMSTCIIHGCSDQSLVMFGYWQLWFIYWDCCM